MSDQNGSHEVLRANPSASHGPTLLAVELLPGQVRGSGTQVKTLRLPATVSALRLHLRFEEPSHELSHKIFEVRLETVEGKTLWSTRQISAESGVRSEGLSLTLPITQIQDGDYILKLNSTGEVPPQEVADYFFRIARSKSVK